MGNYVIEHPILMAGATISILPLAIAFLFLQRYFVRGVAITGLQVNARDLGLSASRTKQIYIRVW